MSEVSEGIPDRSVFDIKVEMPTESSYPISRREVLVAALTAAAVAGVSKLVPPNSRQLPEESVAPKVVSYPTAGRDMIFITSEHQEETLVEEIPIRVTNSAPEPRSATLEDENDHSPASEEVFSGIVLGPEAFASYAGMGGNDTRGEEILDYFPESYVKASDGLRGLWSRAIDAKLSVNPQSDVPLHVNMATLPQETFFDYVSVPEGTRFFDIQERQERILPCSSNAIVVGKIEGEENFLVLYQEPVNNYYYFAKVGEDVLNGQEDLAASKNLIAGAFSPGLQNLEEVGTPEERERLYEVIEGDSLDTIASRFGLPSWHCIYGKNPGISPELLQPGLKLAIPDKYEESDFIEALVLDHNRVTLDEEYFYRGTFSPEDALAIIEASSESRRQLDQRAVALTLSWMRGDDGEILEQERELVRDWHIFKFLAPGQEKTFNNARAILAWHEVRFEMNPAVKKALDRLSDVSSLLNNLIIEKVPVEVFLDNNYPSLPEDWHGIFIYAWDNKKTLRGGFARKNVAILCGPYDQYQEKEPSEEQIQTLLGAFVYYGVHEGTHAFINSASETPAEKLGQAGDLIPADARRGFLAHRTIDILTSMAQRYYGFEEKIDPRIDYILGILKQGGVEDPEAEVIRAAVTLNGDRLWGIYESVRDEDTPSMDLLMSTRESNLQFWLSSQSFRNLTSRLPAQE